MSRWALKVSSTLSCCHHVGVMDPVLPNASGSQSAAKWPRSHRIFSLHLYIHFHFPCSVTEISQEPNAVRNVFSVRLRVVTSVGEMRFSSGKWPWGKFPGQSPSGNCRLEHRSVESDVNQMKSNIRLYGFHWRVSTTLLKWEQAQEKQGSCNILHCWLCPAGPNLQWLSPASMLVGFVSVGQHPPSSSSHVPLTWSAEVVCGALAFPLALWW